MKIFKSSNGGTLAAKFGVVTYYTNLGGTYISPRLVLPGQGSPLEADDWSIYSSAYISPRLILPDQGSPLEADDWSIYPSAKTGLVDCPARLDGDALIIESPHGDLRFIPKNAAGIESDDDIRFMRADANWSSLYRTPHCYAQFKAAEIESDDDIRFMRADANWVSVERTPHCYAQFVDFWKRFATYTDRSRVIY